MFYCTYRRLRAQLKKRDRDELDRVLNGGIQLVRVVLRSLALCQLHAGKTWRRYSMTCRWWWFIHLETAISINRNGSIPLCVFKTHYRDRGSSTEPSHLHADPVFGPYAVGDAASAVENAWAAYSGTIAAPHEYFDQTGSAPAAPRASYRFECPKISRSSRERSRRRVRARAVRYPQPPLPTCEWQTSE